MWRDATLQPRSRFLTHKREPIRVVQGRKRHSEACDVLFPVRRISSRVSACGYWRRLPFSTERLPSDYRAPSTEPSVPPLLVQSQQLAARGPPHKEVLHGWREAVGDAMNSCRVLCDVRTA